MNEALTRVERIPLLKEIKEKKEQAAKERRERLEQSSQEEKVLVKKIAQIQRDICTHLVARAKLLGKDRNHVKYWFFDNFTSVLDFGCGRVFLEGRDNSWSYYDSKEQIEELMNALNGKGIREAALIQSLKRHEDEIMYVLKQRETNLLSGFNQDDSRRSKRLKRSSNSGRSASGYSNNWSENQ